MISTKLGATEIKIPDKAIPDHAKQSGTSKEALCTTCLGGLNRTTSFMHHNREISLLIDGPDGGKEMPIYE